MSKHKHDKGNFRGQFLKHPGFLTKPVTHKEFRREVKANRRLEFGPQLRDLHQQQRASNLQQQRIGDWFPQYLQQVGRLNTQTNAAYDQAVQGTQADSASASAYAEKLRQRIAGENRADAATRGATYNPAVDTQAAQANVARQNSANTFTGLIRSQGASSNAYMLDKKRIGKGEEISQLLGEAARGRQVNQDIKSVRHDEQAMVRQMINDMRPQERDFYLGLLQARLGNKQANLSASTSRANAKLSARTSAANSKRTAASSRAGRRQSAHQFNLTHNRKGQSKGTVGSGGDGRHGHAHQHEQQHAIQHMLGLLQNTSSKKLNNLSRDQIIGKLIGKSTTYTRKEALRALHRYHKKNRQGYGGKYGNP
jgi:hypothetical protein